MQRVDGMYLYQVGSQIHPIAEFTAGVTTWQLAHIPMYVAQGALEPLITRTVFQLKTSVSAGQALLQVLKQMNDLIMAPENTSKYMEPVDDGWIYRIQQALTAFEAVLGAELALIPLYVVTPKGGFALAELIEQGHVCFPSDLLLKVPAAIPDVMEATKALAFELWTAAGFHLHRANESVLRAYFPYVANGLKPPRSGNMGDYLKLMEKHNLGEPKVVASLLQLKNLHRNPLMHPEQNLENMDEAVSLMGAVRAAMGEMLKKVPYLPNLLGTPAHSAAPQPS